jgi:two-component system response regulator AtoC
MAALLRYNWPGNVRELENSIERSAVMTDGKIIDLENLPRVLRANGGPLSPVPSSTDPWPCSLKDSRKGVEKELILKTLQGVNGNRTRAAVLLGISLRALHYKLKGMQQGPASPAPLMRSIGLQSVGPSPPEG